MRYFGTDGIRGPFGQPPITVDFARRLGWAYGTLIKQSHPNPRVLLGRDTRASGIILRDALAQGLNLASITPVDAGIVPTPAIAQRIPLLHFQGGFSITASHNPAADNGLKPFDGQGLKLTQAVEAAIETLIDQSPSLFPAVAPLEVLDLSSLYIESAQAQIAPNTLQGIKLVLDTAHGATYRTTPAVLTYGGAEIVVTGNQPNGININDGVGSEHPEALAQAVIAHQAYGGIAHDGDGDRLVVIDETGRSLPGEVILGCLALHLLRNRALAHNTLVTTIQSNGGLDAAIVAAGGRVIRTDVGDRHVLHTMLEHGASLGGESSGHFIFKSGGLCGDGLIAALELLKYTTQQGLLLSSLHTQIPLFPQRIAAMSVREKKPLETLPSFQTTLQNVKKALAPAGRVLVRYSGTENKLRLLVEGPNESLLDEHLQQLMQAVQQDL